MLLVNHHNYGSFSGAVPEESSAITAYFQFLPFRYQQFQLHR